MNCPSCGKELRVYGSVVVAVDGYFQTEPAGVFDEILMVEENGNDVGDPFCFYCKECNEPIPSKLIEAWDWRRIKNEV